MAIFNCDVKLPEGNPPRIHQDSQEETSSKYGAWSGSSNRKMNKNHTLVGGFNPFETYKSIGMIIPNIWEITKCSKPPISTSSAFRWPWWPFGSKSFIPLIAEQQNVVLILALLKFHPASSRQNLTPPAEITQRHGLPVSQVTDLSARQSLGFSRVVSSLAGCLNFAFGKDWFLSWHDQVKAKETVRHRTTRLGPFYRIIVIRKCLQGSQTQILGRICTMRDSKAGPRQ